MATLKLKLFTMNRCLGRSIAGLNVVRVCKLSCISFCTLIESPKVDDPNPIEVTESLRGGEDDPTVVTESPDIPVWVRISENEDDFVLPSLSHWIDNYKPNNTKRYDETTVSNNKSEIDAKKITKVLQKLHESLDSVVQALNDSGVTPSETLVAQMLKRFDNNWKSAYGVFIWAESQIGSKFSPAMYDLLVDCLGKSKNFDLMWQVVQQMVDIGENYVTINTMAKVIRRLGKAGKHEESIDAFRRIEQFGVKRDLSALNVIIDSLAKEKNVERANDIYLEFKNEIPPNSHTFNSLMHGWSKARQIGKAQTAMEEMKQHGISPDVVSYTSLVEAYCSEKDFRKVDQLLDEMQQNGCPPNIITYTIVMHALGKSKQIDEALKVYEKMKTTGCVLDTSFYSSLIYILSKSGRLNDAREVFNEMSERGIRRDTQTYNTMIASVCRRDREEEAIKLLHEMETSGVRPDLDTYAPLLKMCCKLKRMKVLSFLLTHMMENNVSVGLGTYSLLVRGLSKNGKLKHACSVLEDAVIKGFIPYDTMFTMLEAELEKEGMSEEKKRIQELKLIQPKLGEA